MNNLTESPFNKPILEAIDLKKSFLTPEEEERVIEVIRGASLKVNHQESVSIRGQSGSGKTTLLNILSGLQSPEYGRISWNGQDLSQLSLNELAKLRASFIGFIFQAYYLVPELNALENVVLPHRILGKAVRETDIQRAKDLLIQVGLKKRLHHSVTKLSGGESQRVALCRALMNEPTLILADEPTGSLDEKTGEEVMQLLLNLCKERGVGLVLVTHNPDYAQRTNRQYTLREGRLFEYNK